MYKGDIFMDPAGAISTHVSIPYEFSHNYIYHPYAESMITKEELVPPTVQILEPSDEQLTNGTVKISWYVYDSSGVEKVEVRVDGNLVYTRQASKAASPSI